METLPPQASRSATVPPLIANVPSPTKFRRRRKFIVFAVVGVVLLAIGLGVVFRKGPSIITVQTEPVTRRTITEIVVASGKIQPVTQVIISPEVAGEIVALPVKEGDRVRKGDLLVQIKPDNYRASSNSAVANYRSATASRNLAQAELEKAEAEFQRNQRLFESRLVSDSVFLEFKTAYEVAKLRLENAIHNEAQAKFGLEKASDDLSKTTIISPIDGTVARLNSQVGERVLGTSFNKGTEIMTVADLTEMEARVDIGEMDVVLIQPGQNARLEVDAFRERKFTGAVTEIASSAKGLGQSSMGGGGGGSGGGGASLDATKFEVHIRVKEKELFRPGMSVTAEIETRTRTNTLSVPFASVATRVPKRNQGKTNSISKAESPGTNAATTQTNAVAGTDKKQKETSKAVEVVFVLEGDKVKMVPVKIGIFDNDHYEVIEGLEEGQQVVSGPLKAIGKDLQDGRKAAKGSANSDKKDL